jgi:U3 small nucleolar RNA-associated protein MPP10
VVLTRVEMRQKISELEDAAVAPKSWTMVGEVSLKDRPTNSLLAEDLFFDYSSKPPPVITQERTASLEDTIKQRITKVRPCIKSTKHY